MIFSRLFPAIILASTAFGAPEGAIARRAARHQSKPLQRLSGNTGLSSATNTTNVVYSSNWAGAVWDTYPSGTFYKVAGTFTVPTPNAPDGAASVWVGIDGDTCGTAILQTGVDFYYQNGAISYDSWYEWYPDYAYSFGSPIAIRAGDVVRLTVTASSTTAGTALIENLTTGSSESQSLSYPSYPLCEANAEWIVEDFNSGSGLVPFCNFGTVTFSSTYAYLNSGQVITSYGATEIDMDQGGVVQATVTEYPNGALVIKYI